MSQEPRDIAGWLGKGEVDRPERQPPGRPRGRPPLPPGQAKRYPLSLRTTKEMRDRLAEAVAISGRSLAQEVEFRLERSFYEDEIRRSFAKSS